MASHHSRPDHDDFDDLLLDAVGQLADELVDVPVEDLAERLRAIVQHTLITRRPDGTWPPAELLVEVLGSYLDVFDERLRSEGLSADDLPGDHAWIAAWRECTDHPATFERMLAELRSQDATTGVPRLPPPDDLPLVIDP
jgi:hypothetical protein